MKIIFLEAVQDHGGARKSTVELAKRLKILGHEVLIVDFWGSCKPFVEAVHSAELDLRILEPREHPFIVGNSSKLKLLKNFFIYFFFELKYKNIFSKIVDEFQPDVVSVNNIKCLNILKSNASYTIDFFARSWFEYRNLSYFTKKRIRHYKPRFLAVSQSTRQAIFTGGMAELKNIKVLTTVIEDKVFNSYNPTYKPFNHENPINILFSGGFLKTKGQHTCLAIAKKLKDLGIPFKMSLTGIIYKGEESKKYYNNILNLIKKHNLTHQVSVVLDPPNITDYFKACDILIHPSWLEGLPRVCLEALSFGKPVIANPVGGVTDVVIHNFTGYITDFNVVEQYIEYITRYVEHPELYKLHSTTARRLINQNYLDSNQFENIKRIYPIQ
ncbi:glycosyltransferase family 4 protein [Capnocytophaga stomatis]|uniref:Glycosyltransferase family 4 protein n=1 Tax=Capnocytophaga stomatis TaxID=1848904 RepID=A0ABW8QAS5_9FLAO|nr:glycosyltransferase family 4 protein [Capnocytophaga stomatis]GIJ93923.1 glycosyl transferase group 1 [Capnocytophaga stomatis]